MKNEIKPIETKYKGYRFRSRLEARWAVFFDAIGANWEYEPEGFDLGNGTYYLPDFVIHNIPNGNIDDRPHFEWLRSGRVGSDPASDLSNRNTIKNVWIEVKGEIDLESACKIKKFRDALGKNECLIILGSIPKDLGEMYENSEGYFYGLSFFKWNGYPDLADITYLGADETGKAGLYGSYKWHSRVGLEYEKTEKALNKARSARFEHGENG